MRVPVFLQLALCIKSQSTRITHERAVIGTRVYMRSQLSSPRGFLLWIVGLEVGVTMRTGKGATRGLVVVMFQLNRSVECHVACFTRKVGGIFLVLHVRLKSLSRKILNKLNQETV